MRLACLVLPGFALQVHVRATPRLLGTAFAVVAVGERDVPRILAASRRAVAAGVRAGMTVTQARAVAADVTLVDATPQAYLEARHALGEAALGLSVTVDIEEENAVYTRLPPGAAAPAFAEKLLAAATRLGFRGRVGIADDRFTAWAATQVRTGGVASRVRVVPAGGSAAFLAPLGLELLGAFIDVEVRKTLGLLGVRTLGDFAALPPPSVGRRWARGAVDASALARGLDPRPLVAFMPSEPIRESLELEDDLVEIEPLAFVLRPLFERAIVRLAGRARAVARAALRVRGEGRSTEIIVAPTQPTTSARMLVDLSRAHLAERKLEHPVRLVEVEILADGQAVSETLELFPHEMGAVDSGQIDLAVARLAAAFGADAIFGAEMKDQHRPEAAWAKRSFAPMASTTATTTARRARGPRPPRIVPVVTSGPAPLRLLTPPAPIEAECSSSAEAAPRAVALDGVRREVVEASGPTRLEGEWWTDNPLARDYFEVATADGGRYWLYRDHADGRFYLHGIFD